jgi:hypothetical protein
VVAQPWRRAETLVISGSCVAPLRLGGLRGKQSTPSVGWEVPVSLLGSASGSEGQGKERGTSSEESERQRYGLIGDVECIFIF